MIRFGHHRRYSPERAGNRSPTPNGPSSPPSPSAPPRRRPRRGARPPRGRRGRRRASRSASAAPPPPRPRPARAPGRHLLDRRPHPARPRAAALARAPGALRQARHRVAPVPPLGAPGLWTKLLEALADDHRPGIAVLRRLESWICRAYRRAWRLLGVEGMALARRLGFLSALARPLLAAARPRFVRTGLPQAPHRHAPRPRGRLARPPEGVPRLLPPPARASPPAAAPSRAAWRPHERPRARPSRPEPCHPRPQRALRPRPARSAVGARHPHGRA